MLHFFFFNEGFPNPDLVLDGVILVEKRGLPGDHSEAVLGLLVLALHTHVGDHVDVDGSIARAVRASPAQTRPVGRGGVAGAADAGEGGDTGEEKGDNQEARQV